MKLGIEAEFFVDSVNPDTGVLTPSDALKISHDSCGWLAEARGQAHHSVTDAVFSLEAAFYRLVEEAKRHSLSINTTSHMRKLPRKFIAETVRKAGTKIVHQDIHSIYGEAVRVYPWPTAGIHLNFGESKSEEYVGYKNSGEPVVNHRSVVSDYRWFPQLIKALDDAFAPAIKVSKRQRGIYRLKYFGFEYRSIPTGLTNTQLIEGIREAIKAAKLEILD